MDRSRSQSYVAGSQGMQAASGNWKRQGADSFLEPPFFFFPFPSAPQQVLFLLFIFVFAFYLGAFLKGLVRLALHSDIFINKNKAQKSRL